MRSTDHPRALQLIDDLLSLIFDILKSNYPSPISDAHHIIRLLKRFLRITPKDNIEKVSQHLQIFISSSAPAALVKLYISPDKTLSFTSYNSIWTFVHLLKSELPEHTYTECARMVLEFCKLLRGVSGHNYNYLYNFSLSNIGAMVEAIGISRCKATKELLALKDVFLFLGGLLAEDEVEKGFPVLFDWHLQNHLTIVCGLLSTRRSRLLEESFEYIGHGDPILLRGDLFMGFKHEEATGPELGPRKVVELCPGGKDIVVNSKNRKKYINLLIQYRLVTSIAQQITHFSQGFAHITTLSVQASLFRSLDLEDLDKMLDGSGSDISVKDWKAHTDYNGYTESDPQITWFWKIVEHMSAEQRRMLLFFWTSIRYLPPEGFDGLSSRLSIYRISESCEHLPSAQTCFFRMCLPPYCSMTVMENRLAFITQEHVGCSFGIL
ncbi:hypothetical protein HAX54_037956 [Datura stramonium]|uniref:HECT-type E3 ubiquitin transferase n=1 Tax=Datura stramonium TaxID=4076 RepID=A0ABS8SHI4_DATST|nr:hypothetical protein [Datura stramonium]